MLSQMNIEDPSGWSAVAVAVLAVIISVGAWWAARRSADASERSALATEEVLHQQRTPRFTVEIQEVNGGQWHRLAVRLDGPISLDDLSVESLHDDMVFTADQYGIDRAPPPGNEAAGGRPGRRVAWTYDGDRNGERAGMAIGQTARWRVSAADKHVSADEVTLRVRARAGKAEWTVLAPVTVPGSLQPLSSIG